MASIFEDVLGVDRAGADDDFFELGGNSLIATQVASRLGSALDTRVPVRMLFEASTVAALAARVESHAGDGARKALVAEAARVINIKVGRVGGFAEARAIHDLCAAFDVPVWCGGMLESGIGRAQNIHLASLPSFSKPGDTSSASRYFARDITEQQLESDNGLMPVPRHGPGLGVTLDRGFLDQVTGAREDFR